MSDTIRGVARESWALLSGWQKAVIALVLVSIIIGGGALAVGNLIGWGRVAIAEWKASAAEARAAAAEQRMNDSIAKAAEIASKLREMEKDLARKEGQRDEKQTEVDAANKRVSDDRANYNRAVSEPRTDNPSTDQLCVELAALGYPCTN